MTRDRTTIVIVEDESIVATDLAGKLQQLGYEVAGITAHGEEAVALARRLRPQLVLMDIWLEGPLDGIQAAEAIRHEHDVPVIYLTAHSDPATLARAKLTGPCGYILKPFEERDLATQIELALHKHETDRQLRQLNEELEQRVKQRAAELAEAEAKYRNLVENTLDIPYSVAATGEIRYIGPQTWRYGIDPRDVTGRHFLDAVLDVTCADDRGQMAMDFSKAMADGEAFPSEFRIWAPDGAIHWLEQRSSIQRDAAGRITEVTGVLRDITARKRAEEALRQSEANLKRAQEVAYIGSWHLDVVRNEVVWSDETYRIFGVAPGTPLSYEVFLALVYPDDRTFVDAQWQAALQGKPFELEHRVVVGATVKWVHERAELEFDTQGQVTSATGTTQDVTERRTLEAALTAIAAEERRWFGQDLHDGVGQEMSAIGMMVSNLRARLGDESPHAELAARLEAGIDSAKERLRALAHGLVPVAVDAAGLEVALEDLASQTAEVHGIACEFECEKPVPIEDNTVATQLFFLAREAVHNAVRHAQARRIAIQLREDEGIILTIRDDGRGFSNHLEPAPGRGMGLRIMRHRAGLINGALRVEAPASGGTLVTCVLRRKTSSAPPAGATKHDPRSEIQDPESESRNKHK